MFFELRQYRIKDGKMQRWVKLMEEEIIPFQVSKGMVVCGSFTCPDEPDLYIWIRRFDSEAEKDRLYAAVYQTDFWTQSIKPYIDEMLDRPAIKVTRLASTPKSVIA